MKKVVYQTVALVAMTSAALAASDLLAPEADDVIRIEVAPQELERCRQTLAQVAQMPIVTDAGYALPASAATGLPTVECVATDV